MRSDNLGYTLLLGVMLSFVAAVTIPLGYGLIVFLRGLDEQSRTKYNVALPITMFVVGFVFSAFPLPKLPGGVTFPTPFRTLGVVLIWLSCQLCGNQISGARRHRRDFVSVAASARWRGVFSP